jgi:UDP-N-acetylmuramoyl-tripeptide--D-alanyl-D-alanine ligase
VIPLTLGEIAAAVGGELLAEADVVVTGRVLIDSRAIQPGDLFFALPGDRVDGADFVDSALAAGAVAAVTSRPAPAPIIRVTEPIVAFGELARAVLARLPELKVVGITGSSGKTSTKDLLAQILEIDGPTVAPHESFNNEIGLPRTALLVDFATKYLVLELGARGRGHLAYLCQIARPNVAVVLNVGSAHVGEFGSRSEIAAAKAELVSGVDSDAIVVLNEDDPLVRAMADVAPVGARVITFGESSTAQVRAANASLDSMARAGFDLAIGAGSVRVQLQVAGAHQIANALAAASVATGLGMELPLIASALSAATVRSKWRLAIADTADGITIINDAYNANPESVRAALAALAVIGKGRRTWAVLGEMRELGVESAAQHEAIGRLVVDLGIDRLIVVGRAARPMLGAATAHGSWSGEAIFVDTVAAAGEVLVGEVASGDVVLVKASRAVGLEAVAETLERRSRP